MNKSALFFLACICSLTLSVSASTTSGSSVSLFNGKDLDGWVIESGGQFSVEDGLLKVNQGSGWLRSKERFADFTLIMEFRFLEPEANSGIFVRTEATSKDDKHGWPVNGYQVQCKDILVDTYPLATLIPYGAPPFLDVYSMEALREAYKPAGHWHTYEITAKGETLSVKLNGHLIALGIDIKNLDGHIGIQGEFGFLEFRKIDIQIHTAQ